MTAAVDLARRRYELKMALPASVLAHLEVPLLLHPCGMRVAYPPRTVNSVYFDSLDLDDLEDNYAGISVRTKRRLRWYGDGSGPVRVHLELKCKQALLGWKQSFPLPEPIDVFALPWSDLLRRVRAAATETAAGSLGRTRFATALITYRRDYYVTLDGRVRVTVDQGLRAYDQRLSTRPSRRANLLPGGRGVLEVKADAADSAQLREVVRHLPFHVSKHSKYVRALEAAAR